jgi:radical SAM protein with 4Fe4S-binding SPASM domain
MMPKVGQTLSLPRILYFESTNRCNLRCKGCILYRGSWESDRDITFKELVTITDQLPELEQIFLHGIGEPLLNKQLPEIIRHLKGRNVYVLFNSNGLLLSGQWQHGLIQAGLDELRISLDAASPQGYRKIRNNDKFEQVIENLKSLIWLKKQQRVTHPKLSLWFLGTKENISELPGFVKLAAEIGIGEVYLQRLVYFQDDNGYGIARDSMTLQGSTDGSSGWVQESQDLAARLGIQFNASGLSRPVESLQGETGAKLPWGKCFRPLTLMYITANGNVLPCCISPFSSVDYPSIILGNVFKDTLEEIWSGSKYRNFRKQYQTETPPKCCRGCGVQWSL